MGPPSSETSPIAVVAAMPEELAPLRGRLTGRVSDDGLGAAAVARGGSRGPFEGPFFSRFVRSRAGGLEIERGWLNGRRVVLAATGDGAANARAGVGTLLASGPVAGLIVIGVAGALSAGLPSGALVVGSRVIDEAGRSFAGDADQVAAVARAIGGRTGVVVSAARIADSAAEKQRLAHMAEAGAGAAVVDLESATYLAAAAAADVPWLVLRSVTDTADEALPELLNRSRDGGGAVRRGQVLFGLLRRPHALPFLLTLRGRVARSAEALAAAVVGALPVFDQSNLSACPAAGIAREAVS
jgi:nucleoside phosphorylase